MKRLNHLFGTKTIALLCMMGFTSVTAATFAQNPFVETPVKPGTTQIQTNTGSGNQGQGVSIQSEQNQTAKPQQTAPDPIPLDKPVGKEISMASTNAQKWFDDAMKIAENWEFPDNVINKYGKKITKEDYLKALIWIECNGVHRSPHGKVTKSYVGALGFGQLMPATAKSLKVDPNDAASNLKGMSKYIRDLFNAPNIKNSEGLEKLLKAACGYNMGPYASVMKKSWDDLKLKAPRESVGYGIKLKMCLGFELTAWEKTTACKLLGASSKTIDNVTDEFYGHTQGLLMK